MLSHVTSNLQSFKPLLIPAANALAYGYFVNFISKSYDYLNRGNGIELPDFNVLVSFDRARIRIAQPRSLEVANDAVVTSFKRISCEEVTISGGGRRAFRVYIPKDDTFEKIKGAKGSEAAPPKALRVKTFDVIDFPSPLIALSDFIKQLEQHLLRPDDQSQGYWRSQKSRQLENFFDYLEKRLQEAGYRQPISPTVEFFDFQPTADFTLPP